nr:hypothetical protein [Amycolatopsis deserti]
MDEPPSFRSAHVHLGSAGSSAAKVPASTSTPSANHATSSPSAGRGGSR